jgi:hypothetical protein
MRQALWIAVAAGTMLAVGCAQKAEPAKGPKPKVELPDRPDLSAKAVAEKYTDGAWSVDGLMRRASELNNQEVTVRGTVLSQEICPPGAACKAESHVVLVDEIDKPNRRLQVVGPWSDFDLSFLTKGSSQTLTGKVAMWSPSGRLINMDGILVLPQPKPEEAAQAAAQAAAKP